MSALGITLAIIGNTLALLAIWTAINAHRHELRAIAEQQADERRQQEVQAGFDAGWHTTSRRAR